MADENDKPDLKPVPDMTEARQGVLGHPDGTVLLRIGQGEWWLRRPTFKQYREAVVASDKALKPAKTPPVSEQTLTDPIVHSYLQWAPARFAWWRNIIAALSDTPFPAKDDELPMWLASADPINEIMGLWLTSPPAAPGG